MYKELTECSLEGVNDPFRLGWIEGAYSCGLFIFLCPFVNLHRCRAPNYPLNPRTCIDVALQTPLSTTDVYECAQELCSGFQMCVPNLWIGPL